MWHVNHVNLMQCNSVVYVLDHTSTKIMIICQNHDDLWEGDYFDIKWTLSMIQKFYWWLSIVQTVWSYCETCDSCQRMKTHSHKSYDNLLPLSKSDWSWQNISMNFITDLSLLICKQKACDVLLIVVDQYSKMIWYISCTKDIDAPELAELLIAEIYFKFGALKLIVSDRGSLFMFRW